MSKLQGKVALVTGASKGIGAAIALELASQGAAVAVNYSGSKAGAEKVVDEIKQAGGKAIAVQANVADPDTIGPLIETVTKQLGPISILVNNAGIYDFAPIEAVTPEHFHKQFNVNVLGLLLTTQAALKHFDPKGGSIINIGSVAAGGVPTAAVYSATKGAVDSLRLRWRRNSVRGRFASTRSTPAWLKPKACTLPASSAPTSIRRSSPKRRSAASVSPVTSRLSPRFLRRTMPSGSTARPFKPPAAIACKTENRAPHETGLVSRARRAERKADEPHQRIQIMTYIFFPTLVVAALGLFAAKAGDLLRLRSSSPGPVQTIERGCMGI